MNENDDDHGVLNCSVNCTCDNESSTRLQGNADCDGPAQDEVVSSSYPLDASLSAAFPGWSERGESLPLPVQGLLAGKLETASERAEASDPDAENPTQAQRGGDQDVINATESMQSSDGDVAASQPIHGFESTEVMDQALLSGDAGMAVVLAVDPPGSTPLEDTLQSLFDKLKKLFAGDKKGIAVFLKLGNYLKYLRFLSPLRRRIGRVPTIAEILEFLVSLRGIVIKFGDIGKDALAESKLIAGICYITLNTHPGKVFLDLPDVEQIILCWHELLHMYLADKTGLLSRKATTIDATLSVDELWRIRSYEVQHAGIYWSEGWTLCDIACDELDPEAKAKLCAFAQGAFEEASMHLLAAAEAHRARAAQLRSQNTPEGEHSAQQEMDDALELEALAADVGATVCPCCEDK